MHYEDMDTGNTDVEAVKEMLKLCAVALATGVDQRLYELAQASGTYTAATVAGLVASMLVDAARRSMDVQHPDRAAAWAEAVLTDVASGLSGHVNVAVARRCR